MHKPAINRGWLRILIYLLTVIITMFLFSNLGFILIFAIYGEVLTQVELTERENIFILVIYHLPLMAGVTLLTLLFRKHVDRKSILSLGFQNLRTCKDIFFGFLLGFIFIASGFIILLLTGYISIDKISPDSRFLSGSLILCLLISWIEELSFRGYILNNLAGIYHPYKALIVSSILFAIFHIPNPGISLLAFTNLFLAGILLGIVYIYTKTIWFALSLHFSWNFFQGPVFGFKVSGIEMNGLFIQRLKGVDIITGGEFGFEGSLLCSFLIILSILALDRFYNKRLQYNVG